MQKEKEASALLAHYIDEWRLTADGTAFFSHSSLLQPVRYGSDQAMLKIPMEAEEKWGMLLMVWWDGVGAARVIQYDERALLLERITSTHPSLIDLVKNGDDDEASRVICSVADQLHAPRKASPPALIPLTQWFRDLWPAATKYGGVIAECAAVAKDLLDNQGDIAVLHGDLHHENVLHSDRNGWVAIDPKRLIGERAFDYANIFCNPNKEVALKKGRLERQLKVIAQAAQLDEFHLLRWIAAWVGLSGSWILNDGDDASLDIELAKIVLQALKK